MSSNPKIIRAKFNSRCAETSLPIKKGEMCLYYPSDKKVYHLESDQAYQYRLWRQDESLGYVY